MSEPKESRFHSKLFDKLDDYISANDTKYEAVYTEENAGDGFIDIFIESHLTASVVIELKRDDVQPTETSVLTQAKKYADEKDAELFATGNSNDFYLFDYQGFKQDGHVDAQDLDYIYYNLDEFSESDATMGGFIPKLLENAHSLYKGETVHQSQREKVVGVLRTFHNTTWPIYKSLAEEKYGKRADFSRAFDSWVESGGYDSSSQSKQLEIAAKQYTYLLANRVLFYELLRENEVGRGYNHSIPEIDTVGSGGVMDRLQYQFGEIVDKIDYEPIFSDSTDGKEEETLFETFPHNRKSQSHLQALVQNLTRHDIAEINEDLLGEIYEELIPADERKELGQFYTPPSFAEAIVRWAVNTHHEKHGDRPPKVVDPSSGSGTFPVEVYHQLAETYGLDHETLIDLIHFVEINRFPIHLTALNLASRSPSNPTDHINSYHTSFMDEIPELDKADIFVGNPPYISSRNLYPDSDHFRQHLESIDDGRYLDGDARMSKRSDAYAYFITKAISHLKDGGLLGFIIPTKWMTANYGDAVKQFLNENTKIHHIVTYSKRAFEDAEVTTCLLLLEKSKNSDARQDNITQFTHLKQQLTPDDLYHTLTSTPPELDGDFGIESMSGYRTIAVRQSEIFERPDEKIEYYSRTPGPAITNIIRGESTVMLGEIADIDSGIKTGSNEFFLLSNEDVAIHGLDPEQPYLQPAMTSRNDSVGDNWIVLVDDLLPESVKTNKEAKQYLRELGFDELVKYIEYGEEKSLNTGRTCNKRDVWFRLKNPSNDRVLLPKGVHKKVNGIDNRDRLYPKNRFYIVRQSIHSDEFLVALLHSVVTQISCESVGRNSGGGNLEIPGSDWKQVRIPDPSIFSTEEKSNIIDAYESGKINQMNKLIVNSMSVEGTSEQYEAIAQKMLDARIGRGGDSELMLGDDMEKY